ncbi:uncharacterized protein LOC115770797 [Drosophila novamexicana]|uniref:uncharacterized protein LOC115770797 n=1 Tax=Drosophila novamexicana TaxID=47314 RepID=UPI0011E5C76D|nr:uncharacterized protein LOC115770797 [Drosophila novamexicana]
MCPVVRDGRTLGLKSKSQATKAVSTGLLILYMLPTEPQSRVIPGVCFNFASSEQQSPGLLYKPDLASVSQEFFSDNDFLIASTERKVKQRFNVLEISVISVFFFL